MKPLPPARWIIGDPDAVPPGQDYLGTGLDWEPATLLHAYAHGTFPMPAAPESAEIDWWSPDPRGILEPERFRATRSLRRSAQRFTVTLDRAFDEVVAGCAAEERPGRWIDSHVRSAYGELHRLGWAHSVEVWSGDELVGGLYGLELGGLFAGESMFHRANDASKVALLALVDILRSVPGERCIDVQWLTPHLASLGCVEIPRSAYLARLPRLLAQDEALSD